MLTDTKVRNAKPRPKPYKISDANRLFLLVAPSGGKLWRWNYTYDGKNKTMAFGAYPLVSLADARARRDEAYTVLCEGLDPAVARKLKIEANVEASRLTFERVAREWYANAKAQWASVHSADIIRSLQRDVFPTIGDLPIAQLTPPLVLGVLREIEARGAIETAKRARSGLSQKAFTVTKLTVVDRSGDEITIDASEGVTVMEANRRRSRYHDARRRRRRWRGACSRRCGTRRGPGRHVDGIGSFDGLHAGQGNRVITDDGGWTWRRGARRRQCRSRACIQRARPGRSRFARSGRGLECP